jgi:predicted esterase
MSSVPSQRVGATLALIFSASFAACAGGSAGTPSGAAGTTGTAGTTGAQAGTVGSAGSGESGTTGAGGNSAAAGDTGGAGTTVGTGGSAAGAGGSAAGAGGSAAGGMSGGAGAAGGSLGTAGGAAGGAAGHFGPTGPSAGCGMAPTQSTAVYVKHNIMVTGVDAAYAARNYYLRLPTGYDPTRKYPTVFLGPGCGGDGMSVLPIQNASKADAILVGLSPVGQCFKTNGDASPDNPFFDAVLKEVEASSCIDTGKVFVAGFSSGSWLANQLGCLRAGVLRGQGNCTGGLPGGMAKCAGPLAAMLAHDTTDTANVIAGGMAARDRILKINGCATTATVAFDAGTPSPCVQYTSCPAAYPVVWCQTTGKGHSDQIPISTTGFWKFWSSLP